MLTSVSWMPRSASSPKTCAASRSAPSQAPVSHCCEPTWNDTPVGTRPSERACVRTSTAISGTQPNLRDSGHSAPSPDVRTRQNTRAPGAARATFSTSSTQSTANRVTPSAWAAATSRSFLIVLP